MPSDEDDELKEYIDRYKAEFDDRGLWLLATRVIREIYYSKDLSDKQKLWNMKNIRSECATYEEPILRELK